MQDSQGQEGSYIVEVFAEHITRYAARALLNKSERSAAQGHVCAVAAAEQESGGNNSCSQLVSAR